MGTPTDPDVVCPVASAAHHMRRGATQPELPQAALICLELLGESLGAKAAWHPERSSTGRVFKKARGSVLASWGGNGRPASQPASQPDSQPASPQAGQLRGPPLGLRIKELEIITLSNTGRYRLVSEQNHFERFALCFPYFGAPLLVV